MSDLASQIAEAKKAGYSDAEITTFLGSSHPELAPKIKEAQDGGYGASEIVGFLSAAPTVSKGTTSGFHHGSIALKGPSVGMPGHIPLQPPGQMEGESTPDYMAGQASAAARNIGTAALPAALPGIAAHPLAAMAGAGVGIPVQQGVQALGEHFGYPGMGALGGDVAGLAAGTGASKIVPSAVDLISRMSGSPELKKALIDFIPYWGSKINKVHDLLQNLPQTPAPLGEPVQRNPAWAGITPTQPSLPPVEPIPSTLPSGRIPGVPQPQPAIAPRNPLWQGIPQPSAEALPDIQPIQSPLPSGRVPGQPIPPTPPPARTPLWQGTPQPNAAALPDVNPIQPAGGKLPSGRSPQATQGIQSVPIETPPPKPTPTMNGEPLSKFVDFLRQRMPGSTPKMDLSKLGPSNSEGIMPKPTGTEPMDWPELNKMIHNTATDVSLPGSPSGVKPLKGQVSNIAYDMFKDNYKGLPPLEVYRKLSPEEMTKLHEFIRTGKK